MRHTQIQTVVVALVLRAAALIHGHVRLIRHGRHRKALILCVQFGQQQQHVPHRLLLFVLVMDLLLHLLHLFGVQTLAHVRLLLFRQLVHHSGGARITLDFGAAHLLHYRLIAARLDGPRRARLRSPSRAVHIDECARLGQPILAQLQRRLVQFVAQMQLHRMAILRGVRTIGALVLMDVRM